MVDSRCCDCDYFSRLQPEFGSCKSDGGNRLVMDNDPSCDGYKSAPSAYLLGTKKLSEMTLPLPALFKCADKSHLFFADWLSEKNGVFTQVQVARLIELGHIVPSKAEELLRLSYVERRGDYVPDYGDMDREEVMRYLRLLDDDHCKRNEEAQNVHNV